MTINKKEKVLISIIVFGGIIFLLVFLLIFPLFKEIKRSSEDFVSSKKEIASFEIQTKNLEEFRQFYQKNLSDLEKFDKLFIDPEVPLDFIGFLEKVSQDSKIKIKISLFPSKGVKKEIWPFVQFQISAFSSFSNFSKFLEKIETAHYLIEIQNLNINRLTEDELKSEEFKGFSFGDIKANLLLKVYTK